MEDEFDPRISYLERSITIKKEKIREKKAEEHELLALLSSLKEELKFIHDDEKRIVSIAKQDEHKLSKIKDSISISPIDNIELQRVVYSEIDEADTAEREKKKFERRSVVSQSKTDDAIRQLSDQTKKEHQLKDEISIVSKSLKSEENDRQSKNNLLMLEISELKSIIESQEDLSRVLGEQIQVLEDAIELDGIDSEFLATLSSYSK
ncbi:hypothetical protein ADUPG1_009503 [Aduncisulcus paluster]|uniref:Uncharacterized protein n=1 Tax=Aduncisulcus paluster TaxID=2918883 RepID=A0ABQ5KVS7_9EUKA|nr:hypothetical protein ADUPG1_009503 [Aduncisulcus paluster]|eukprot:gnl/Carplike_NY0171/8461_a11734_148.p1 GENE.gnl/Carplike_NY0171/8461_a11734_148~~gnl/Carplike_NY0171/8461_a11734_148.p1  ORF type:complete len:214 (-),score=44.13 gnl/Carplike_NY0171/8461_a11734_148:7-627(-)